MKLVQVILVIVLALPLAFGGTLVSGQSKQVPRIDLQCSTTALNIPSNASKWDSAFADAYFVWLTTDPGVKYYKYAGSNDNALARIKCDLNSFYFLVEYIVPNDSGTVSYNLPFAFGVFIDTMNHKNSVPQHEDYRFSFIKDVAYPGLWYTWGTGDSNKGYFGWADNPGNKIYDSSFAKSDEAGQSTSVFKQSHPVIYLEISKSYERINFNINNPFGLALEIIDGHVVSNETGWTTYYALFPPDLYYTKSSTWADVYTSNRTQTTTTVSSVTTSITMTSKTTTPVTTTSSQSTVAITTSQAIGLNIFANAVALVAVAAVIVAVSAALYFHKRKPKTP